MTSLDSKLDWEGELLSVQPRIRLTRSFDESSHTDLGYVLRVRGTLAGETGEFVVAIGKAAHEKHEFRSGDRVSGVGERIENARVETADIYKVSGLKVLGRAGESLVHSPPFLGVPPARRGMSWEEEDWVGEDATAHRGPDE